MAEESDSEASDDQATSPQNEVQVGQLKFFRNKLLGKGAYGEVYRGHLHGRTVGVKRVLRTDFRPMEESMFQVSHENLLRYLAKEETADFIYFALELCAGTLEDLISHKYVGPSPGLTMEEVMLQTALGLCYLHENKIIHRDIKPQNILIWTSEDSTNRSVMKLADFGLSKLKVDGSSSVSKSESVIGTPSWSAPECIDENKKKITPSADVFSLGCVFGYILTGGSHPFGDSSNRKSNILNGETDWKQEHLVRTDDMKELIKDMIKKEPARERPPLSSVIEKLCTIEERDRRLIYLCNQTDGDSQQELLEEIATAVQYKLYLGFTDDRGRNLLMLVLECGLNIAETNNETHNLITTYRCADRLLTENTVSLFNINHRDRDGRNALHYLCGFDSQPYMADIAEKMISRGSDGVNELQTTSHWTPLHLACSFSQNGNLIRVLLKHNANPEMRLETDETALLLLAKHYKGTDIDELMKLLIRSGANVNATDKFGANALINLCCFNADNDKIVEAATVLLENEITVSQVDRINLNAMNYICRYGEEAEQKTHQIVKLLIRAEGDHALLNGQNAIYDPLLLLCKFYNGNDLVDILETLLDYGVANIRASDADGSNALLLVCKHYSSCRLQDVIQCLIDREVDVSAKDKDGHNAVHHLFHNPNVASHQFQEIARMLLQ